MSYVTAKAHIENLINIRQNLIKEYRVFNGLTFQSIEALQEALKKVDSPVSFALFITTYWTTINLLPPILDSAHRKIITTYLEKAKSLLNSSVNEQTRTI